MNILKTAIVAGAMIAASVAGAADANAATRLVVRGHNGHVTARIVHRAPVRARVVVSTPVLVAGWSAERVNYHPYTYYRGNPRLRACFAVTQRGWHNRRHAMMGATMCYGKNGAVYVVPTSRHFVRFL